MKSRIVFFGTGPVAAKSLELLYQHCEIEAVITKPRPEKHRGDYPVLDVVQKYNLTCFTVLNKQDLEVLVTTHKFNSPVGILVDFGIIVSKPTIDAFSLGIINSHFSLLPEWRGADPITFSILSGQKTTGVSLMLVDEGLDTGPLIAQSAYNIKSDETMPSLTAQLIKLSDLMIRQVLPRYILGDVIPKPQDVETIASSKTPSYSRKLTKSDGLINWTKPAEIIEREIRAYQPWPRSYTKFGDLVIVITKAHVVKNKRSTAKPGDIEINKSEGSLSICTGDGLLQVDMLQPQGRNEMSSAAFINGYSNIIGRKAT